MLARCTLVTSGVAILVVLLHGASLALGGDPASERVTELLVASGDRAALPRMVDALAKSVTAALSTVADPDDTERIVSETITVEDVFDRLVTGATRGFEADRASRLLAWLRTPAAQRITQLELKGAEASESEIAAYNARPDGAPDPRRARLLERLETATHASEMNLELVLAIQRGLARGALPPSAPSPRRSPNEAARRSFVDSERAQVLAQQRYAYRELTTDELAAYVEIVEQDDHQWFGRLVRAALVDAIESTCEDAARKTLGSARRRPPAERT
jgi:hypothetical protein